MVCKNIVRMKPRNNITRAARLTGVLVAEQLQFVVEVEVVTVVVEQQTGQLPAAQVQVQRKEFAVEGPVR